MIKRSASDTPNMRSAIMAWAKLTKVFIVGKRQVDFKTVESVYMKECHIFRNPTGQQLQMLPEGQRAWNSEKIFSDMDLELKVDDLIMLDCETSQKYRVMNKTDYSQFGYYEYDIMSDYKK
jgi:hypothetical protein